MPKTTIGWGALLLATAATMIAYHVGITSWKLIVFFALVAIGCVMLKIGD